MEKEDKIESSKPKYEMGGPSGVIGFLIVVPSLTYFVTEKCRSVSKQTLNNFDNFGYGLFIYPLLQEWLLGHPNRNHFQIFLFAINRMTRIQYSRVSKIKRIFYIVHQGPHFNNQIIHLLDNIVWGKTIKHIYSGPSLIRTPPFPSTVKITEFTIPIHGSG